MSNIEKNYITKLFNTNRYLQIAHGTAFCVGESHIKRQLGYQDAQFCINQEGIFVGILCDGCSTTADNFTKNHVGAVLGSELIAHHLFHASQTKIHMETLDFEQVLSQAGKASFGFFKHLIGALKTPKLGIDRQKFVDEKLLFTVLGLMIINEQYCIFGCGDGCFGINTHNFILGRSDTNQHFLQKLCYNEKSQSFEVYQTGSVDKGDRLWVASDGLLSIFDKENGDELFQSFLEDRLTCLNDKGIDQTIRPFRKLTQSFHNIFNDDTTIIIAKIREAF